VLTVDEKWFTARIKPPQVRLIPVADGMSEDTGRFRLESLGSAPGAKIHAFCKGGGGILREILSSRVRTKSGGACSIGTRKGVSGSGSPRDRNGVENGGRKDATFLRPPW